MAGEQARLRAISMLATAIAGHVTRAEILHSFVRVGGETLGADRSLIYDIREREQEAVGLVEWINPGGPAVTPTLATYPLALFAAVQEKMARTRAAFTSHAVDPDPLLRVTGAAEPLHGAMSIQSLLWVPFGFHDDGFHVFVVNQVHSARSWSASEVAFVETLSHLVELALHKLAMVSDVEVATARAAASADRYRMLYDNTPSMFFTLDRAGKVLTTNQFALSHLGFEQDGLVGRDVEQLVDPEDWVAARAQLVSAFAEPGRVLVRELRKKKRDGETIWVKETMRAYLSERGESEVLVVCDDITHARRAAESLARAQNIDSIGLLARQIAHDFNNLLMGILTNAERAVSLAPATSPLAPLLANIQHGGELGRDLVRRVLAFSGRPSAREPVLLGALCSEVITLLSSLVPEGITLRLVAEEGPRPVLADPTQLKQLVMNLVMNAIEEMRGSGGTVTVRTRGLLGDRALVEIEDEGGGVPEALVARIFDPLFTTKREGRGLGLAAVAGVVKAHGGTIEVVRGERGGALFRVVLPNGMSRSAAASSSSPPVESGRPLRVLIVDDASLLRRVIADVLEDLGYSGLAAGTPQEALRFAQDEDLACAVIDLRLGLGDGQELAAKLDVLQPGLPIVWMSGALHGDLPCDGASLLRKPFSALELSEAVQLACARRLRET